MILDSSVIFKWFQQEEGTEKALSLYQKVKEEKVNLSLPKLFFYEIGNILLHHQPYSREKIIQAKEILGTLPISFYDFNLREWYEIIEEAHQLKVSFYDYSYVYLAKQLNTFLITADKKLYKRTKKLGLVKLL